MSVSNLKTCILIIHKYMYNNAYEKMTGESFAYANKSSKLAAGPI